MLICACASPQRVERASEPLPSAIADAELQTVAGGTIRLSDLRGQVVLLDVWAAWCGPCRESLPAYAKLQRELGPRGFAVVAVSVDEDAGVVRRQLDADPVPFAVVLDPEGRVPEALGVDAMPECFLVDRDGRIRLRHRGFHGGDDEKLRREIVRLIDGG